MLKMDGLTAGELGHLVLKDGHEDNELSAYIESLFVRRAELFTTHMDVEAAGFRVMGFVSVFLCDSHDICPTEVIQVVCEGGGVGDNLKSVVTERAVNLAVDTAFGRIRDGLCGVMPIATAIDLQFDAKHKLDASLESSGHLDGGGLVAVLVDGFVCLTVVIRTGGAVVAIIDFFEIVGDSTAILAGDVAVIIAIVADAVAPFIAVGEVGDEVISAVVALASIRGDTVHAPVFRVATPVHGHRVAIVVVVILTTVLAVEVFVVTAFLADVSVSGFGHGVRVELLVAIGTTDTGGFIGGRHNFSSLSVVVALVGHGLCRVFKVQRWMDGQRSQTAGFSLVGPWSDPIWHVATREKVNPQNQVFSKKLST
jgi:hypothetical protein